MNIALIVAAGKGTRLNTTEPKQFLLIKNKPLAVYTIEAFNRCDLINAIVVVTSEDRVSQVKDWCAQYDLSKVKVVVKGGETRQESVRNGLIAANELSNNSDNDIVLIHDAARVLVSEEIIRNNIEACSSYDAVCTVIKAKDTMVRSSNEETINDVANRNELYQVQTPQTFKLSLILKAHDNSGQNSATDDAQLLVALGHEVHFVMGSSLNFKVTTAEDLSLLEALLK